jgi:hypothetical protein
MTIFISKAMKQTDSKKSLVDIDSEMDFDQYLGEADDLIEVDKKGITNHMFEKQLPEPSYQWQ